MSDLARAVGAGSSIEIDGKTYILSPLTLKDWGQIDRECLETYRKNYIKTYKDNLSEIPVELQTTLIRETIEKAARMTTADLPKQNVNVPVFKSGRLVVDDAGQPTFKTLLLPYATWWASETFEGKLYTSWLSVKKQHKEVSIDQWDELMMKAVESDSSKIDEAAELVSRMSMPQSVQQDTQQGN